MTDRCDECEQPMGEEYPRSKSIRHDGLCAICAIAESTDVDLFGQLVEFLFFRLWLTQSLVT